MRRDKALVISYSSENQTTFQDRVILEREEDSYPSVADVSEEFNEIATMLNDGPNKVREAVVVAILTQQELRQITAYMEIHNEEIIEAEWEETVDENRDPDEENDEEEDEEEDEENDEENDEEEE